MAAPIALVTHSLSYAGPAAVQALTQQGFHVLMHDPAFAQPPPAGSPFPLAQSASEVLHESEPAALIAQVIRRHGRIDAIVSNDTFPAIHGPTASLSTAQLRDTLEALVVFPFQLMQAAIPHMVEQQYGRVVFITSHRTALPMPGGALPDMARAAANALVSSLSVELSPHGVAVNAIAPNYYYSEAYFPRSLYIENEVGRKFVEQAVPVGRLGTAEELGALIGFLATLPGNFQTGAIIPFTGGWPAAPPRPF